MHCCLSFRHSTPLQCLSQAWHEHTHSECLYDSQSFFFFFFTKLNSLWSLTSQFLSLQPVRSVTTELWLQTTAAPSVRCTATLWGRDPLPVPVTKASSGLRRTLPLCPAHVSAFNSIYTWCITGMCPLTTIVRFTLLFKSWYDF